MRFIKSVVVIASVMALLVNNQMQSMEEDLSLKNFKIYIPHDKIQEGIKQMADRLNNEYMNRQFTLVSVMKGAMMFTADLMKNLRPGSCSLEYVQASSYGQNGETAGQLALRGLENVSLKNKHVLLVDDIYDTGHTLAALKNELLKQEPASLETIVLLLKDKSPMNYKALPDNWVLKIEDKFVIGYGMDYKERYRELPDIYVKK